jgi:isocitrate dehydrogenase
MQHTVTLIEGDGVGKEVTSAVRRIIDATKVSINWELCQAGAEVFKKRLGSGVPRETIESISRNKVALKGPLETPIGYGEKSANVTLRKVFETYGNIRPACILPGIITRFPNVDLVVVRENVEDLYTGIEHMQTPEVAQCLKIITRPGCEKIIRLAFNYARSQGRRSIHCATKANIMKFTEGLFKKVFEEVAIDYPDITPHHILVDNCAHQLVMDPSQFEMIVTTNMNGDILSDLCSGLVGGLGVAPSANLGKEVALFEAVHGSAPDIAGKDMVNPTALILSSLMMLRHIGEFEAAELIEKGLYKTLGDGIMTRDMVGPSKYVGTRAFTDAVIQNLGKTPSQWVDKKSIPFMQPYVPSTNSSAVQKMIGVDIFLSGASNPHSLGHALENIAKSVGLTLHMIANRGIQVYPSHFEAPSMVDYWACRFIKGNNQALQDSEIMDLLRNIQAPYIWTHIEKLWFLDGNPGFSKAQGED